MPVWLELGFAKLRLKVSCALHAFISHFFHLNLGDGVGTMNRRQEAFYQFMGMRDAALDPALTTPVDAA